MQRLLTAVAILLAFSQGFAQISDNLCDTECQYCCRNHVCQSQQYCTSGDTNYYAIIGGVAGGIVGLIVLRIIYVKVIRPQFCRPRAIKESEEPKSRHVRKPQAENSEKKKKSKKPGIGLKKKKTLNEDIESKGEKKADKYNALAGNSISTPNASILNKPEINGSVISQSKQDLENPDTKPRSRIDVEEPPKEQALSKGVRPSSQKSGEKDKRSSSGNKHSDKSKDKSKPSGDRSKSKEKMAGSNMDRSKSKEKSGSNMDKSKKRDMASSSKSRKSDADDAKKAARENGDNQL